MVNYFKKISLTPMFILLIMITAFSQTNLISNGDFENGLTGWQAWSATVTVTSDSHAGSKAAMVSNRKNPWDAIAIDITKLIQNGHIYNLSAWIKIPGPAVNLRATIALNIDGASSYHGYIWTNNPVIGAYNNYNETFTLTWTGQLISANLYFETESVNGIYSDYLLDDVQLVEIEKVEDIIQTGPGWKDIKSSMLIGGCATEGSKNYWTSEAAKAQLLKDCNTVTVQCYPGWGRWDETKHHVYHVDEFTNRVKDMKNEGMSVTAHMLMGWDQYFPEWFKTNDFPADTLDAIMKSWLKAIIAYKGNDTLVDTWNVVNEAISWNGKGGYWPLYNANFNDACEFQRMGMEPDASGLTGTEFVNSQHPVYIRKAFEYARSLTNKKLELRDSGFEFPGDSKYSAFYQLAKHLKNMNTPVDVIGFQTHLDLEKNYDWEGYTNNIKRYVKLGYQVIIPEVDIGDKAKEWSEEKAESQKLQYYKLITAAIHGGASELQTWGFIDDGWRPGEKAFPYTNNYGQKPAYYGITEALTDMSSILFWEMDSPSENIMPDVMKYNNFGVLNHFEKPVIVSGYIGKALLFDGADDYISTETLSESVSGNLTLSLYLKTSSVHNQVVADLSNGDQPGLMIKINQNGEIIIPAQGSGLIADLVSEKAIADGQWHFLAVQRDSNLIRLYVDDSAPVIMGISNQPNFNKLTVGANVNGTESFTGAVDEVKLFCSAIEEGSFIRNYAPYPPDGLVLTNRSMTIKLTWKDKTSNESGFLIERKTGTGEWEEAGRVAANITSYIETLTLYDTEYSFRVRSFTSVGKSNETNTVTYTTPENPSTGISETDETNGISLYPNPTSGRFKINISGNFSLKILDIQGKIRMSKTDVSPLELIDISEFPKGIYLISITKESQVKILKLVRN